MDTARARSLIAGMAAYVLLPSRSHGASAGAIEQVLRFIEDPKTSLYNAGGKVLHAIDVIWCAITPPDRQSN